MMKNFLEKLKSNIEKNWIYALAVSLVSFLIVAAFSLSSAYDFFELKLYDLRFRMKPKLPQWEMLTLLKMDDNSIKAVGEFPWPRYVYSEGLSVLDAVGIRQFAFDIQFIDESPRVVNRDEMQKLQERTKKGGRISAEDLQKSYQDNDRILADAIKSSGRVILPFSFINERLSEVEMSEKQRAEQESAIRLFTERASVPVPKERLGEYKGLIDARRKLIQYPVSPLVKPAHAFGYVDSDSDIDGTIRKQRLVRMFEGRIYFHMSLVMLMDLCGVNKEKVEIIPGSRITLRGAVNPLTLQKEDIDIPIDKQGMMLINWAGPFEKGFNQLSFYALLEYGRVRDEIHEFFDAEEVKSGSTERSALYGKLSGLEGEFAAAEEESARHRVWKEMLQTRKKIRGIEAKLVKPLRDEIKKLTEEVKKTRTPEMEEALANMNNFMTAIEIVTSVEKLRDHSVLIGYTATATHDIGVTPVAPEYPKMGTYHNIVNTVLQKSFIRKVDAPVTYAIMLVLALAIGVVIQRLSATRSIITMIGSIILINVVVMLLFAFADIWIDQLGLTLALFLPSLVIASVKFMSEESQKRFIKSAFSHYLSPRVIDEILKNPDYLKLGGEARQITIFFSDVAGFSTISESLTPPELVTLLNEYLSQMTDIILGHDGTVDKYEGDAIMAFYGAPNRLPDHAVKACFAAIDMKKRLAEMRETWRKLGKHELRVRMGMNSGEAVVGNMGSHTRMDYTAMGDSVNLASRLEGANKFYNTYAIISQSTYEAARDAVETRKLDLIRVVGKNEPITVYELLARKGQLPDYMYEMISKYNEGLELFKGREWEKARNAFRAGLRVVKDDGPCKTYVDRCTEFLSSPPPKNWDGVYKLKSK